MARHLRISSALGVSYLGGLGVLAFNPILHTQETQKRIVQSAPLFGVAKNGCSEELRRGE
jgi:hypothetical protein